MEEVESRFLHLLQPIRDLTKNWEVDVASQLGEYLEELDQICISFDNGRTTMNFIEAALVIQGSACIYSRKVEYLYSLVYQALDLISNKKREKQPSSVGPDGRDADATFGSEEEEKFLSLDDIRDSSQASVDIRKDHQPNAVNIVPLTPMSLVPPEEAEKKANPLLSRKGELLASRKDFRMNTSTPHSTGAFLLELAGVSPICLHQVGVPGRAAGTLSGILSKREQESIRNDPVQALNFSGVGGAAGPDDDDDSRGDDMPGDLEDAAKVIPTATEHIEAQRSVPQAKGYMLRERAPAQDPKAHVKEMLDPWQSLDPFGDSEDKPFKKGRPFLVPHGLGDMAGGKRKRKSPRKLQDFMKWFSAAYSNVPDSQKTKRKGPTFADLEVLYWKRLKERMAAQRELHKRVVSRHWAYRDSLCAPPGHWWAVEPPRGSGSPLPTDDFVEHEDLSPEGPEEVVEGDLVPSCDPGSLCYEELVRRNVELFIANSQKYARETELSQHIRHWEERIGPLLQEQAGTPLGWGRQGRDPFDIRSYGATVAEGCKTLGQWHSFASLVAGQSPFEVCRYMLATLQLANDYVVELAQAPGLDAALDTARLRLLTQELAHERFQEFQLPSA
ncbi:CNDH2 protein, partial [Bucco capensis]|nr:CNDH2 protein [Bucco capensis]